MTTACLPEEEPLLCSHSRTVSVRCDERQNKPDNIFVMPEIALGPRWSCPQKYSGDIKKRRPVTVCVRVCVFSLRCDVDTGGFPVSGCQ